MWLIRFWALESAPIRSLYWKKQTANAKSINGQKNSFCHYCQTEIIERQPSSGTNGQFWKHKKVRQAPLRVYSRGRRSYLSLELGGIPEESLRSGSTCPPPRPLSGPACHGDATKKSTRRKTFPAE